MSRMSRNIRRGKQYGVDSGIKSCITVRWRLGFATLNLQLTVNVAVLKHTWLRPMSRLEHFGGHTLPCQQRPPVEPKTF